MDYTIILAALHGFRVYHKRYNLMYIIHTIEPIYDENSRVLILGTMPSPKSREAAFYYAHPQNRFWHVIAHIFGESTPQTAGGRKDFMLRHGLALWDVLHSCEIEKASDASIKSPVANDLSPILATAHIRAIFCTGAKSAELYRRLTEPKTGIPAIRLPSPSPANCAVPFERLCEEYSKILQYV